jgi:hypothetical protein
LAAGDGHALVKVALRRLWHQPLDDCLSQAFNPVPSNSRRCDNVTPGQDTSCFVRLQEVCFSGNYKTLACVFSSMNSAIQQVRGGNQFKQQISGASGGSPPLDTGQLNGCRQHLP